MRRYKKRTKRTVRYPKVLRIRLTAEAMAELEREAGEEPISSYVRRRMEVVVGLEQSIPARRTVRAPDDLAKAVMHLGSLSGNLQRIYTVLTTMGRCDEELLSVKADLKAASVVVRAAIGVDNDP